MGAGPLLGSEPNRRVAGSIVIQSRCLQRGWCREGRKLDIGYVDETGSASQRIVRPFMIGYVATVRLAMAWCESRGDFRVIRTDRMTAIAFLNERYPERSVTLRRRWLAIRREKLVGIPSPG